jgi:hypothetical protein
MGTRMGTKFASILTTFRLAPLGPAALVQLTLTVLDGRRLDLVFAHARVKLSSERSETANGARFRRTSPRGVKNNRIPTRRWPLHHRRHAVELDIVERARVVGRLKLALGTASHTSHSTRSSRRCPAWTLRQPDTRTCTETNERRPERRVRNP